MFSFALTASAANSITSRLKGRLLLQVQDKGRIWYVDPVGLQKHEVTFANALSLFQKLALGITNTDLIKIPADLDSMNPNLDSDNDGYPDKEELQNGYSPYIPGSNQGRFKTDNNLATKLKGRLLLQVQDRGRIWYIDQNGKRWEVTWGNLMSLFRKLALGITDKDLETVGNVETANWQTYKNSKYGYEIKYPKDWTMVDDTGKEINSAVHFYPSETMKQIEAYKGGSINFNDFLKYTFVTVSKYNRTPDETLGEEVDGHMKVFPGYTQEDMVVNGIKGIKLTRQVPDNKEVTQIDIFLDTNSNNGTMHIQLGGSEVDRYLDIFNKFLTTLKVY